VLHDTDHVPTPTGALDAILPLIVLVFGTAQVPPPVNISSFELQLAVAVAALEGTVTTRVLCEIPDGPAGPDGPIGPWGPGTPAAPVGPGRPWQSRASHTPSPLISSDGSQM
jgi:hypothetical protein